MNEKKVHTRRSENIINKRPLHKIQQHFEWCEWCIIQDFLESAILFSLVLFNVRGCSHSGDNEVECVHSWVDLPFCHFENLLPRSFGSIHH